MGGWDVGGEEAGVGAGHRWGRGGRWEEDEALSKWLEVEFEED